MEKGLHLKEVIFNSRGKNRAIFLNKKRQVGVTTFLTDFAKDVGRVLYVVHSEYMTRHLQEEYNIIQGRNGVYITTLGSLSKYILNNSFDFVIFDECDLIKTISKINSIGITCPKIITTSKEEGVDLNGKNQANKYHVEQLSDYCTVSWFTDINETISYPPSEKPKGQGEQKLTLEYQKNQMFEMVWERMSISEENREKVLPIKTLETFLKQSVATYNGAKQETYTVYDLDFLVKNTDIIVHGMVCQVLAAQAIYEKSTEWSVIKQVTKIGQMPPDISRLLQDQYIFETNLYYQKLYCKF